MTPAPSTAQAILQCARSLIVAGGYQGFSYADIAAVVGIRKASIHHHFPTKVDLVLSLVRQYRAEAEAGIAAIERHRSDPVDQLQDYVGYWQACIDKPETSYCLCALLATQMPVLPEQIALELRGYFRALAGWMASVIERGVRQGSFVVAGDARAEAEMLMATVHGAMLSARAYGDAQAFTDITQPALERLRAPSSTATRSQPTTR
ncbi:TetR/AcrR family transcriptional regulator [Mycobacterium paraterrae]|uniref:TetR/AcrR family transcriptional regulator n=1 Tax=Mycobacterium paraterrae TaxID=577492 RepID=A0ABY3VLT2_9MYCO|nr:TetR/AcrR family transcriptional regulator [Mycobacterium paraterrae]UMB69566.1 TetR/AcrR family transcriptional regulator [Mycobacterium paraterrae]